MVLVYTQHAHLDTPTLRGWPFPLWVSALDSSPEPRNANGGKRQRAELEGGLTWEPVCPRDAGSHSAVLWFK